MPIVSKETSPHRIWADVCKAWTLIDSNQMTVKEESMPPDTCEELHFHLHARQFFYILKGKAIIFENGEQLDLSAGEGFEVPPRVKHFIKNPGPAELTFLLLSSPSADNDRYINDVSSNIDLDNRKFRALSNSDTGEVTASTEFHYRQSGDIVWATYGGGDIVFGTLSGEIRNGKLKFNYQHRNRNNQYMTGICHSEIKTVDGSIQLHEKWQWTCADYSEGTSVLQEIEN